MAEAFQTIRNLYIAFSVLMIAISYFLWLGVYLLQSATGNYSTIIFTNAFGEHDLELGMFLVASPYLLVVSLRALRRIV